MSNDDVIYRTKRGGHRFELLNREISWLAFNERVLQEASDETVPLLERIKFLAIFSSNLDEFFRIRVPSQRKLLELPKSEKEKLLFDPEYILDCINAKTLQLQSRFEQIYQNQILPKLEEEGIFLKDETDLSLEQANQVRTIFRTQILPYTTPIMLTGTSVTPHLKDRYLYLAVKMYDENTPKEYKYGLIELPTKFINRFFELESSELGKTDIILLEDVIRFNLIYLFGIFNFNRFESFIIKLTRNQEMDIDHDFNESMIEQLNKSLKARKRGEPVRFIYDSALPKDFLNYLIKKFKLEKSSLIPGGRYHNFSDFMSFPDAGKTHLRYPVLLPQPHFYLDSHTRMFDAISRKDVLLHHPYQSFDYVLRFLREAAIDPSVSSIKITLYRVARISQVANSLITAAMNGKEVTAIVELKARFDEETNIYWAEKLKEAGVKVIYGFHNLKVHCKLCLVTRTEKGLPVHYAHLSTGNYNGQTARLYCDDGLLTNDIRLTQDVANVFRWMENATRHYYFDHLLVGPNFLREGFEKLIRKEIENAKSGKTAWMKLKMNSLVDEKMIELLYEASRAGVKIDLVVRGMCCLVAGMKNMSENIRVVSIVDRFLEHSRIYVFANGGREKVFLASADWMNRNLSNRVEVAFPIYDKTLREEIKSLLQMQIDDSCKARILDPECLNEFVRDESRTSLRSQSAIYHFLKPQLRFFKKPVEKTKS